MAGLLLTATLLLVATVMVHAVGTTQWLGRLRNRYATANGDIRMILRFRALVLTAIFLTFLHVVEVFLWALAYLYVVPGAELDTLEEAFYFSAVTFTTLGFGDITLNSDWRVLSGIQAINGILLIGWSTAFIFAVLQHSWGSITISPPGEKVRDWPIIGERVHSVWSEAADGVEAVINEFEPQLKEAGQWLVGAAGSVVGGVLHFAVSLIVVGVLLLNAHGAYSLSCALATKIAGERGPYLTDLSIAIVRSVTKGVLGVALIQALLSTIGLMVMGVPAAGILGAIVLVTAIVQIPTLLIMGPIVFWVFSFAEPVPATIFAVYALLVSLSDNVLKPMLLGRGVDAPMLVILIGAIGGAIAGGLIGLFVGAVILALGYAIFDDWLNHAETNEASDRDTSPA